MPVWLAEGRNDLPDDRCIWDWISINIPSLTDEQKFSCEVSITEEECIKALQSFQGNKVPGNRGLSIEFYSICWAIISDPFVNCVNECFTNGEMSLSQKQAVITL